MGLFFFFLFVTLLLCWQINTYLLTYLLTLSNLHFSRGMAGMSMSVALQSKLRSADKEFQRKEDKLNVNTAT